MRAKGMKPDMTTFNTLIKGYGRLKQLPEAMKVLSEMQREGIVPDQRTYSTLAEACGNVGDVARVMEMRERMGQGAPRELELACLEALIKAYAVIRDVGGAEAALADLERQGMRLTTKGHAALMDAYANAGQPHRVKECIEQMREGGTQPNKVHYSILLKAFCNDNMIDEALDVLQTEILVPDAVCFNIVIHAAIRTQDLDALVRVLRIMEHSGVPPDAQTREALDRAGSTAASLKVGALLSSFSNVFKARVSGGIGFPNKIASTISGASMGGGEEVPPGGEP